MSPGRIDFKRLRGRVLVLGGLSAVAVAWPVLDAYGKNPEAFVANRTSPLNIILFGLIAALLVPAICLLLLVLAEMVGPRTAKVMFYTLFFSLAGAAGLIISRQLSPESNVWSILLTVAVVILIAALYHFFADGLRYFALAIPVVLGLFLVTSAASGLIWAGQANAADTGPVGHPTSILFIQLDELPLASLMEGEHINGSLFPNFARLEAEGTWYRNALSESIATTQSVPSALTGTMFGEDLKPTAVDHPDSLFTLLSESHDMHVIEWVAQLCSEDICPDYAGRSPAQFSSLLTDAFIVYGHLTLPPRLRDELPAVDNAWKGFVGQDDEALDGAPVDVPGFPVPRPGLRSPWVNWMQRIINGIAANEPPTLHYTHLKAPHVPWQTNPSGTHYVTVEDYGEVDGVERMGHWVDDQARATLGLQRHLFQLGFLDAMLGSAFDRLDETGNWDETMIIIVADHGASFVAGEHRRWPYENNRDDLYRVPLFVKYPGQTAGEVRDEPAFLTDLLPTVVDVQDIDTDLEFDGISLLDLATTDRPHQVIGWCCNREPVSTDLQILFDQVQRNHTWIPDQSSWAGVVASGPYADLVGSTVDGLEVLGVGDLVWSFDEQSGLVPSESEEGMVQTLLSGRIELPERMVGNDLLVEVNGIVAGTGLVIRESPTAGELRAIIAEEFLSGNDNEVALLVPGPGDTWLTGTSETITVDYRNENGDSLIIVPEGGTKIQIDTVNRAGNRWTITGWAADVPGERTPDSIYIYAGDQLITYGPPNLDNHDVVRWTGSEALLRSGFQFEIAEDELPADVERIAVVAAFGDEAIVESTGLG